MFTFVFHSAKHNLSFIRIPWLTQERCAFTILLLDVIMQTYMLVYIFIRQLDLTPEWLIVIQHVQLLHRIIQKLEVCDTELLAHTTRAHVRKKGVLLESLEFWIPKNSK